MTSQNSDPKWSCLWTSGGAEWRTGICGVLDCRGENGTPIASNVRFSRPWSLLLDWLNNGDLKTVELNDLKGFAFSNLSTAMCTILTGPEKDTKTKAHSIFSLCPSYSRLFWMTLSRVLSKMVLMRRPETSNGQWRSKCSSRPFPRFWRPFPWLHSHSPEKRRQLRNPRRTWNWTNHSTLFKWIYKTVLRVDA